MTDNKTDNKPEFMKDVRDKFRTAVDYWEEQHKQSKEAMEFCNPDCQWPEDVKSQRSGRPTYASDRLNSQVKSLTNAQRENRPGITVSPCGDGADEETAQVIQGLFRHIEQRSKADLAYDTAFEDCVRCGLGYWRILTEYENDTSFNQEIQIDPITNPFQIYPDPSFKSPDGSDMEWCFLIETLTLDAFKLQYPNSTVASWSQLEWNNNNNDWISTGEKSIIIAEFFYKTNEVKKLIRLKDGSVKDKKDCNKKELEQKLGERDVIVPKIKWCKINGEEVLEETDWLGKFIPVVPVFGDRLLNINDYKTLYTGLVSKCKEEQMMLNVSKSVAVELIAAMPKTPWIGPTGFTASHKQDWQDINQKNLAYIEYDAFDSQGNQLPPPERNLADAPIQGIMTFMESIENDIKATNSMFDPMLGQKVSNQSGVAVKALQQQGSITNYHYSDNLTRAIRLTGEIIMDLIPHIYSEKRVVRIIGLDDKAELVTLNDPEALNGVFDLSEGRYEVAVTSGPSYLTRRQENLQVLMDLASKDPAMMTWAPDLIISQMDFPMKQAFVDRAVKVLPPGLQPQPKTGQQMDPQQMSNQLQQQQQMIQQLTQTLQKETELADKVTQDQQTKLQIAQLDASTEVAKHNATLQHESNSTLLKLEIERLKEESKQSHALLVEVHKHLANKDLATHNANLQAQQGLATNLPTPGANNEQV